MRSVPSSPPPALPPSQTRLDALAELLDRCEAPADCHTVFHVVDHGHDFDLGVRPLEPGQHPFTALAGTVAPADWWAVGVRASGHAHHLEGPRRSPSPTTVTFLAARTGEEASVLRVAGERAPSNGRAQGTLADLCRRMLELPTDPAPTSRAPLWTVLWLDRVMAAWNRPERRRELLLDWSTIAALHPAFDDGSTPAGDVVQAGRALAEQLTWSDLRGGSRTVPLPEIDLSPQVAAWMDDGFFARWTMGAFPPITALTTDLRGLLGPAHGAQLVRTVLRLLR